ncbi:MAG: HutD family protein [Aminipila sp.]
MSNIKIRTYKKDEYKIGKWSGGTTTELGIYPDDYQYSERKFIWRLSSATVEIEESDFTSLPEYDRVLIVLDGEVVLVHKEIRVARLAQYEQDRFSGAFETKSFGKITDFNLMVKKGNQGFAEAITLTNECIPLKVDKFDEYKKMSQGFYCAEGFCEISLNKQSYQLNAGELLIINCDYGDIYETEIRGEGKTIRTHVYFNEEENCRKNNQEQELPQQTIKYKSIFENMKLAARVCWSNFKGIFKKVK